jgi:ketosteroid isomerase-like protein
MICRQVVLAFAVIALCFAPSAARGDDLDDLKATFEQEVKAFNARDFSSYVATAHEHVVLFGQFPPFELEGIESYRKRYQTLFANNQSVTFTPLTPQFRVIDNVGVAWGHDKLELKPKNGPAQIYSGRYTFVYTKANGKWLRVVAHASPEPTPPATP